MGFSHSRQTRINNALSREPANAKNHGHETCRITTLPRFKPGVDPDEVGVGCARNNRHTTGKKIWPVLDPSYPIPQDFSSDKHRRETLRTSWSRRQAHQPPRQAVQVDMATNFAPAELCARNFLCKVRLLPKLLSVRPTRPSLALWPCHACSVVPRGEF